MSWGDSDIQPAPLRRPCAACGGAFQYLNRLNLCDACQDDYDADMREVEARERADEDAAATRAYYNW
jgi:hypothetical protein